MQFLGYVAKADGSAEVSLNIGDGRRTVVTIQLPTTPLTQEDFERLVGEQIKLVRELMSRVGYLNTLVMYQTLDFDKESSDVPA